MKDLKSVVELYINCGSNLWQPSEIKLSLTPSDVYIKCFLNLKSLELGSIPAVFGEEYLKQKFKPAQVYDYLWRVNFPKIPCYHKPRERLPNKVFIALINDTELVALHAEMKPCKTLAKRFGYFFQYVYHVESGILEECSWY
jgi:hypothetical protein